MIFLLKMTDWVQQRPREGRIHVNLLSYQRIRLVYLLLHMYNYISYHSIQVAQVNIYISYSELSSRFKHVLFEHI